MGSFQASGLLQEFTVQGEGEAEPTRVAHGSGLIGTALGLSCLYPTWTIWSTTFAEPAKRAPSSQVFTNVNPSARESLALKQPSRQRNPGSSSPAWDLL
jgi:hypothetical protein